MILGLHLTTQDNRENHVDVRVIEANDAGSSNTFFIGTDGGISRMTNGNAWTDITGQGMTLTNFYGCAISEQNDRMIFAGAQDGSINYYNDGDWYETVPGGDNGDCLINPFNNNMIIQESQHYVVRGTLGRKQCQFFELSSCWQLDESASLESFSF